jgi:hypothetical protein
LGLEGLIGQFVRFAVLFPGDRDNFEIVQRGGQPLHLEVERFHFLLLNPIKAIKLFYHEFRIGIDENLRRPQADSLFQA